MLDIIIPVYKNIPGLYATLMSFGTQVNKDVFVTIVDDASGDDYTEIINFFQKFFPIRVLTMPQNGGPGMARQHGINHTSQPYILFVDAGDVMSNNNAIIKMLSTVRENPEVKWFVWSFWEEYSNHEMIIKDPTNNHLHSKIYCRDFLTKHNITFCPDSPRANEDIGFNVQHRLLCKNYEKQGTYPAMYIEEPMIIWKWDDNSIVRGNSCAYYYKDQNMGLALNEYYALTNAIANNVDESIILQERYISMVYMYLCYCSTMGRRPEFEDDALIGAVWHYVNNFRDWGAKDVELLKRIYYDHLAVFLSDPNDPMRDIFTTFDFPGFLDKLESIAKQLPPEDFEI